MSAATAEMTEDGAGADFDYSTLGKADRVWLRRAAAELRVRLRRSVKDVVVAGRVLARARNRLGRGRWEPWLDREAQVPRRSASRLIAVHGTFGSVGVEVLDRFTPTALYVLSEPGVPRSIREYAVEQAKEGAEVTAGRVKEWIDLQWEREKTAAPLKLATRDEKPPEVFDADTVNAPGNWMAIAGIINPDTSLYLTCSEDAENEDLLFAGTLIDPEGRRKTAAGPTLESVVLSLAGTRREKICKGPCGLLKSLDQFSRRRDLKDGRNRYCLECERTRVKNYEREKTAAARRASASGAA